MNIKNRATNSQRSPLVAFATLPGPNRKRKPSPYCYRLTHRSGSPREPGCVLLWDVMGGREIYQVAMERLSGGKLQWHCTCADAVYRGSTQHVCKHIRGLIEQGRSKREFVDSSSCCDSSLAIG